MLLTLDDSMLLRRDVSSSTSAAAVLAKVDSEAEAMDGIPTSGDGLLFRPWVLAADRQPDGRQALVDLHKGIRLGGEHGFRALGF